MTRVRSRVQEQFGTTPAPPGALAPFILSAKAGAAATPGGNPNPYPATSRTLEVWHPWLYPFPGSTDFRINATFNSPGAGNVTPAALALQFPQLKKGIITSVGYSLQNMTTATQVLWQILVNKRPVNGWQNLTFFPGNVPRISASEDAKIPVPAGGLVEVLFQNIDGAAYTVGANYYGWFWDDEAERQWMGEAQ